MHPALPPRPRAAAAHLPRLVGACLAGLSALAQAAPASDEQVNELKARLEQSLRVIDQLSQRVQALEKTAPATAAAAEPGQWGSVVTQRVNDLEQQVSALGARTQDGVPVHGFVDLGALSTSRQDAVRKGATVGSMDFYLATQTGQVRTLTELNFEVDPQGAVGTDLERIQAGYTFNDTLTLWFGRFHSPYGYWNTAYHHGGQIQPSILRPRFLDFEDRGGILPAHDVGLWATGKAGLGGTTLHYDAWIANAPRISADGVLDQNQAGATNGHALFGTNLSLPFGGATLGLHALSGRIGGPVDSRSASSLKVLGGYALYNDDDWEAMAEYFGFDDRNTADGATHASHAAYVHVGRGFGAWTPYARYELASLSQADDYFRLQASGQSYRRALLGVKYDLDPRSSLKLEFNRTRLTDRTIDSYNESRLQYAIRF